MAIKVSLDKSSPAPPSVPWVAMNGAFQQAMQSALQGGGGVSSYYNGLLGRRNLIDRVKSQGTAAFTQGVQSTGSCLQFGNTAGWADVPADVSHLTSDAATVEAWINTSATPDAFNGQVIYIGKNDPGASPRISVDASSRIKVYWSGSGTGGSHASSDTRPITDGRWHHIAVVVDHGAITFYKDGQPTTEATPVTMPGGQPAGSPCQIGAGFGDATGFVGQVFDLRLWNQPRTAEQIRALRYGAVDGSLTQQLGTLKQQGLLIAASFDSGRAPVNLVSGATGDLTDCTIVQTTLPGNTPTITFGPSASDVHGVWNYLSPQTIARMKGAISDPEQWAQQVENQMLMQGFFTDLQTRGDDAFGDAQDRNGMPLKMAQWQDRNGVVHTLQVGARFARPQGSGLAADPIPTGGGATAQVVYDTQGQSVLVIQKIEKIADWTGTGTTLAFLLSMAMSKGLTKYLNTMKSELSGGVEWLSMQEKLAVAESDEAFRAIVTVEKGIKAAQIVERASVVLAIIAALVDGIFRLFHPATMSVSMWNETDLDLEWSLGYLNDGSYWLNTDGNPNGDWRPFPKKNAVNDDVSPIFGPIQYETVAAVNLVFGNGKSGVPLAVEDIQQCILIREKGSTGDPYVLLINTPLVGANCMGMGKGEGDKNYFLDKAAGTPSQLSVDQTFTIDGKAVDFHLVTDALSGQTTYAGIQGYNYNTLLYIKSQTSSQTDA